MYRWVSVALIYLMKIKQEVYVYLINRILSPQEFYLEQKSK